jgi:hypothetical protein
MRYATQVIADTIEEHELSYLSAIAGSRYSVMCSCGSHWLADSPGHGRAIHGEHRAESVRLALLRADAQTVAPARPFLTVQHLTSH